MSTFLWVLLLLILAVVGFVAVVGREKALAMMFGPADQGPVDFATLGKPTRPNTALMAPEGLVTGRRIDAVSPVFDYPAEQVRAAVKAIALGEPLTEAVHIDQTGLHDRYVQRTEKMRFPDTIDVKVIDLGHGRSTLALFSRSLVGYRDFNVNKARLDRWMGKLAKALKDPA